MANTVLRIGLTRIPAKIFKEIVPKIAVVMTRFTSWGAGADKGQKNEAVNSPSFMFECYGLIAVFVRGCFYNPLRFFVQNIFGATPPAYDGLSPERPNPAVIRNLITRKLRNIFPNFFGDGKILGSHGRNLLGFGGGQSRCPVHAGPRLAFLYHNVWRIDKIKAPRISLFGRE
jgi:hypothetical protein